MPAHRVVVLSPDVACRRLVELLLYALEEARLYLLDPGNGAPLPFRWSKQTLIYTLYPGGILPRPVVDCSSAGIDRSCDHPFGHAGFELQALSLVHSVCCVWRMN